MEDQNSIQEAKTSRDGSIEKLAADEASVGQSGLLPCHACEETGTVTLGCAFGKPIQSDCPACGGRGKTAHRTSITLPRDLESIFHNGQKLPPRRELEAQLEKWKRRAKAFHEGYQEKSFEVTALEIQLMDLRAYGADKVTARNNESLRMKLTAVCIERNEAKQERDALHDALANLAFSYDARDKGDGCWCSIQRDETYFERYGTHEATCQAARAALALASTQDTNTPKAAQP